MSVILRLAVVLACFTGGCVSSHRHSGDGSVPDPLPASIAGRFCYPHAEVRGEMLPLEDRRRYRVFDVRLATATDDAAGAPITIEYYQPRVEAPAPVILVLPILNGQKHVVRPFARHFAHRGFAAVIVDTVQRRTLLQDLVDPERAIRTTILRHRQVLDWVESQPALDATRIGVFGASLGGFNAYYLAATDTRIRAVAAALTAADLPYVLAHSTERRIVRAVDEAARELSIERAAMEDYLAGAIETDTLTLAPFVRPDRVFLVLARRDQAVPYDKQLQLFEALDEPQALFLPTGHVQSALFLLQVRARVFRFLRGKLLEAQAPAPVVRSPGRC